MNSDERQAGAGPIDSRGAADQSDVTAAASETKAVGERTGTMPVVRSRAVGAQAFGALAIGALAFGALAIGALAIGRLAVARLAIGKSRVHKLAIDELDVQRLRVGELQITDRLVMPDDGDLKT